MWLFLFAVFLVVACATGAAADSLHDAAFAIERGDFTLAARLLRPFAEQGEAVAQVSLGGMYASGHGVPQDYQEAVKWYRKAAEQGNAWGQVILGQMHRNGEGVPQDHQEAAKWYRKAAEQGNPAAQDFLGQMYYNGQGVPQDFVRAHMWSTVAAAALSGDTAKGVMKFRDSVASRMTAAQIGKAQEMARRCQEIKFKECD